MTRLDKALVERSIARSRERAKEMIASGNVTVNGRVVLKSSAEVADDDVIESSEEELYVGRGALKLEKAAREFEIDFTDKTCLDIGASTGGFTDFMLKNGAKQVYAVDVGHGQLAETLCSDSRVINLEGTDIRSVTVDDIGGSADFISVDVSFISLTKILPKVYELLKIGETAAVLIKPQFEAGRADIGKNGIVRSKKAHIRVLSEIDAFACGIGFVAEKYICSPIKGGSGNIEYLVKLRKTEGAPVIHNFSELVEASFRLL